jgi:hypothetical protein
MIKDLGELILKILDKYGAGNPTTIFALILLIGMLSLFGLTIWLLAGSGIKSKK